MAVDISNIKRQLLDIVNEGKKFKNIHQVTQEKVEQFSRYCMDLKSFLMEYSDNDMIKERLDQITKINYREAEYKLWVRVLMFVALVPAMIILVRQYYKRQQCQSRIQEITSLYSSIQFLFKNYEK